MTIQKEINWELIDNMLISGCSGPQCAAAIGVHPDTLYDRCQADKKTLFSQYAQAKRAHGDGLLHAAQFQKAYKDKNPTMLIWLGKQRLSQKDDHQVVINQTSKLAEEISKDIKQEDIITE
jgi:hypothetical protein